MPSPNAQTESRYLRFEDETTEGRKTVIERVVSIQHGDTLGHIRWFGRWRQYAFFPAPNTVWNGECMSAVNARLAALMAARRG